MQTHVSTPQVPEPVLTKNDKRPRQQPKVISHCRTPTADLLSDLDQLTVEKWKQSDKTIWALNQIIYAGAKAGCKKQATRGKAMPEVNLKERVEMKKAKSPRPGLCWA